MVILSVVGNERVVTSSGSEHGSELILPGLEPGYLMAVTSGNYEAYGPLLICTMGMIILII